MRTVNPTFMHWADFDCTVQAVGKFNPLEYGINLGADKLRKAGYEKCARGLAAFEWFATPVDRLIQAFVTPFFAAIGYCRGEELSLKNVIIGIVGLPPSVILKTTVIWSALLGNTLLNLVPFKLINALMSEKRAEYFFQARTKTVVSWMNEYNTWRSDLQRGESWELLKLHFMSRNSTVASASSLGMMNLTEI